MLGQVPESTLRGENQIVALAEQIILHHGALPRAPTHRLGVRHSAVRRPHDSLPRFLHFSPRLLVIRQHEPPHRLPLLPSLHALRPLLRDLHEPIHVLPPQEPSPPHVSLQQSRPHVHPDHVKPRPPHAPAERLHGAPDLGLRLHDVDEEELQKAVVDVERVALALADDAVGAQPAAQRGVVHEAVVDAAGAAQDEEARGVVAAEQLGHVGVAVVVEFAQNGVAEMQKICEVSEEGAATRRGSRVVLERQPEELVEDFPVVYCE